MIIYKINKLFYLICVILLLGCKGYKKSSDYKPLPFSEKLSKYKSVTNFESLFTLVGSTQLDNSRDAILGYTWGACNINNKYIISDPISIKSIKAFSLNGNFIKRVGKNGNGPDEYISPDLLTSNKNYIAVFDPVQMKLMIYNNKLEFVKAWKTTYYIEEITLDNKNQLIVLRKPGFGYNYDMDLYNINGDIEYSFVLPKSSNEKNRKYLFGGSYKIKAQNDRVYYIGADEYKLVCYNIAKKEIEWISNELPSIINIPDIPSNLNSRKRIAWMKKNYTPLRGFYIFKNGLLVIHIPEYFLMYDNHGNYLTKLKVNDKDKLFYAQNNMLYSLTFPIKNNEDVILNPKVFIYQIISTNL